MMDDIDSTLFTHCKEYSTIPLPCWQPVSLSDIWIPSHLLSNRNDKGVAQKGNFNVFHMLEEYGYMKQIESFSTYDCNADTDEIFYSDSDKNSVSSVESIDESIQHSNLSENFSCFKENSKLNSLEYITNHTVYENHIQNNENLNLMKFSSSSSNDSKNDPSASYSAVSQFASSSSSHNHPNDTNNASTNIHDSVQNSLPTILVNKLEDIDPPNLCSVKKKKKGKSKQGKKKIASQKYITFDELFGPIDKDIQSDRAFQKYADHILREKSIKENGLPLSSNCEFPNLLDNLPEKSDDTLLFTKPSLNGKTVGKTNFESNVEPTSELTQMEEHLYKDISETLPEIPFEPCIESLVIENIPAGCTDEDICSVLSGYGEIQSFFLTPHGKNFKADVVLSLNRDDIDWIIECLNGSDLFGVSCDPLRCYKV